MRGVSVHSSRQREDERGEVEAEATARCEPEITRSETTGFNASPTTLQKNLLFFILAISLSFLLSLIPL